MLAENQPSVAGGVLIADIESNSSIKSVISFIELRFAEFSVAMVRDTSVTAKTSEDALVGKLCYFLNREATPYPFYFHHQFMEDPTSGASPKVDIGTMSRFSEIEIGDKNYGLDDSFFSIEAKRLPILDSTRKREYVVGEDKPRGGIERFKKGIHGRKLAQAAIVAFVQKEEFDYWFLKINEWIKELIESKNDIWKEDDKLIKVLSKYDLGKYMSHNYRKVDEKVDYIDLLHFWVKVAIE